MRVNRFRLVGAVLVPLLSVPAISTSLDSGHSHAAAASTSVPNEMNARQLHKYWVTLWNENRWNELGELYAEDALIVPPNHEPIQGRKNIIDYWRVQRPVLGETEGGDDPFRVTTDQDLTSVVGKFFFVKRNVRITSHEFYQRQPDGRTELVVDMFGFRDPIK